MHEYFKIYAGNKHPWDIDMVNLLNVFLDRYFSMSCASMNVWLFVIVLIMTGIEI